MSDAARTIRIVIADDHPIFREGLRRLLESEGTFEIVGQAGDGEEAVQKVRELAPDVLLLDLAMPRGGGLTALRELAEADLQTRTVVLTAAIDGDEAVQALGAGARGIVLKEAATQVLFKCVRSVAAGEFWVGHGQVADLLNSLAEDRRQSRARATAATLTRRERQLVAAIVGGATNKDIANQLNLSEQTVKNHLSNVFDKLGVSNRLELALYALHHRLLEDDDGK